LIKPEVMAPVVSEPEEVMLPTLRVVAERLVEEAVVAKKLVVVAEVPVAFTKVKFWRVVEEVTMRLVVVAWPAMVRPEEVVPPPMVEEAVTRRLERVVRPAVAVTVPVKLAADEIVCPLIVPEVILPKVALPTLSAVAKRLVEEATEAKKLVVVAFVEVELRAVKFCRVEDPESKRFERVVRPPVAVTVPVKLAADEIVWPLIKPEVIAPSVEFPAVRAVAKRLVEEAVVAKKLVVVAFEEVELSAVKLRSVEEPDISKLESEVRPEVTFKVPVNEAAEEIVWPLIKPEVMAPVVSEPEEVMLPTLRVVAERLVEEAVVAKKLVVVAEVPVAFTKVKFWRVVELRARIFEN